MARRKRSTAHCTWDSIGLLFDIADNDRPAPQPIAIIFSIHAFNSDLLKRQSLAI
jgi:hypothetical protein